MPTDYAKLRAKVATMSDAEKDARVRELYMAPDSTQEELDELTGFLIGFGEEDPPAQ
jgi:hypothetical protein